MLLLYCLTSSAVSGTPSRGIGDVLLEQVASGEVVCWYTTGTPPSNAARQDLLAYHGVLSGFLARQAVIPFRFPTTLPDKPALAAWLAENAAKIAGELHRLAGVVQMEVHIAGEAGAVAQSGKEYLESRRDAQHSLAAAAEMARQSVADIAPEWRQRETREGWRCYALVPRGKERDFVARIDASGLGSRIRVTGPWPPAEFLDPALTSFA